MKAGYMFITYPDRLTAIGLTMDDLSADLVTRGAETVYIYHDHDVAVPHYHMIAFWARNPLKWDEFKQWLKDHNCICPRKDSNILYDYETARIKDIDSAVRYLTHEQAQETD